MYKDIDDESRTSIEVITLAKDTFNSFDKQELIDILIEELNEDTIIDYAKDADGRWYDSSKRVDLGNRALI